MAQVGGPLLRLELAKGLDVGVFDQVFVQLMVGRGPLGQSGDCLVFCTHCLSFRHAPGVEVGLGRCAFCAGPKPRGCHVAALLCG